MIPLQPGGPLRRVPAGLQWLQDSPSGRSWLEGLPRLVAECAERWSLRVAEPFQGSHVSLVLPATLPDATEAVLKLQLPYRECEHEAAALALWDGDAAVRLLDHDPERRALLIERCRPGTCLSELGGDTALSVLIGLLPRLWKPATEPFEPLAREAARWSVHLPERWGRAGRPFEHTLLDEALSALARLSSSQSESVLLHQDLHPGNVLRAEREPWLAIDPKPLVGEREFGIAPIVRAHELGDSRTLVVARLDRLSVELGLDRERARGWAFAQTLAWAFEGDEVLPRHLATARWLHEAA